jgi:GAF domain-containing protein
MDKHNQKEVLIPQSMLDDWNKRLENITMVTNIPVGVILKINNAEMEVLITNKNEKNPYKPGYSFPVHGTYCEETINSKTYVFIPNASKDPKWIESVNYKKGMVSYLGFPIRKPDGTVFGTICLNDYVPNESLIKYIEIVEELRNHIEKELRKLEK